MTTVPDDPAPQVEAFFDEDGALPEPESNRVRHLKIPLDAA